MKINPVHFCPKCHKKNIVPKWMLQENVKVEGNINLTCACGGIISIKGNK